MNHYSQQFYLDNHPGAVRSARVVVPLAADLLKPRSVGDVGCGLGSWLAVWQEHGIDDLLGIDGANVEQAALVIAPQRFLMHDLATPLRLNRTFDLVMCLEVAEHLPASSADALIDALVALAPAVLFSAAIPYQGGTHHVNEQWPGYWAARFRARGYVAIDCFRRLLWSDERVEWWYAQNLLLYARLDKVLSDSTLLREFAATHPAQLSLVHPRRYLALAHQHARSNLAGPQTSS